MALTVIYIHFPISCKTKCKIAIYGMDISTI